MGKNSSNKICFFDSESDCKNCDLKNRLICETTKKELLLFNIPFLFGFVVTIFGLWFHNLYENLLIFTGLFITFYIFFFCFFEIKILCSHCPYYAEDSKILHCYANYGIPKLWNYNPNPMNIYEKIGLIFTFLSIALLFFYPIFLFLLNNYYFFAVIIISDIIIFFVILTSYFCTSCPNFSCPFNRVEKKVVKKFLDKNLIIKKAWNKK